MMPLYYLLLFLLLPLLSLLHLLPKIIKNSKSRCNPPGPLGLPIIGNLHQIDTSSLHTIVMRVGFGKKYEDENERRRIVGLIGELQVMIAHLFLSDLWPGLPLVGLVDKLTGNIDRLDKCFHDLDSFYQELIDERLDPRNQKSHDQEQQYIIDILIQLKKDQVLNPIELTNDHIKAMLTDVLVAGTDTSAAIVVWAMTSLIKNPKVMKKAQEEVRNVVGKKTKIDEDDLPKLTYLKAIVKEVMRLYPPAPLLVPRETKKDTILHGYNIKQNTMVHVNAFAIGRDPESWENPEEFLPERFLGNDIDFRGNDFEFIPFGAGRRICPGISMGAMLVELLLANLVYFFDWGLPPVMKIEDIDYEVMPGITMHKKNELCLLPIIYIPI